MRRPGKLLALLVFASWLGHGQAQPFIEPGRPDLRHNLLMLQDMGSLSLPAQTWPISRPDLDQAYSGLDVAALNNAQQSAISALRTLPKSTGDWQFATSAFVGKNPIGIRSFENSPRAEAGAGFSAFRSSGRISINISGNALIDPMDEDNFSLDGTYISADLGNWVASAGWQERWWGPGNNSSLILSSNARPSPGIALQRRVSHAFESRWLAWIGPWTLTTFMNVLDDDRVIEDALLWGARVGIVPIAGLEIGLSRTAQWCGSGRPCSLDTFSDVLMGNDNRGVNVDVEDEPGNQLAGVDVRWRLPRSLPAAVYMQWIGEDTRNGGPEIGSWLRMAGAEAWGYMGSGSYHLFVEWADTTCREGGAGFSDEKPNCAYRHPIYENGYTYNGRSTGHSADGDSRVFSLGATLVQSADYYWNIRARHMEINRVGLVENSHTISADATDISDITMSLSRKLAIGRIELSIALAEVSSGLADDGTETSAFFRWSSL